MATQQQDENAGTVEKNAIEPARQAGEANRAARRRREQEEADRKAAVEDALDAVEQFVVVHPSVNLFVGKTAEDGSVTAPESFTAADGTEHDVVDGWVPVPRGTRLKATTAEELRDFREKVQLGFLTAVEPK